MQDPAKREGPTGSPCGSGDPVLGGSLGFEALPHDAWPDVAAALSLPWPRRAAEHDLRWYAAERHVYQRTLPTERDLATRWGWSKTVVHRLLVGTEWIDETRPWLWRLDQKRTNDGPETDQETRVTAESSQVTDQERTKSGPKADLTRVPFSPSTPHPSPGEVLAHVEVSPSKITPVKVPKFPGYTEAIAAYDEEHRLAFEGAAYPWCFVGRETDAGRIKAWLATARVSADDINPGVDRIRLAARSYFQAVIAKATWPAGEPAQTRWFTRDLSKWLRIDPASVKIGSESQLSIFARMARGE